MKPVHICAIVRDEANYIAEWIAFHRIVGVCRFVIYDDRSRDDTIQIMEDMNRGDIIVYPYSKDWHGPKYHGIRGNCIGFDTVPQCCAYNHYGVHHPHFGWTAFIDVDEYLFHTTGECLTKALEPYENYGGLAVPWLVFGSSGHKTRPKQPTIEAYTKRGIIGQPHPWGMHFKTVVNFCKGQPIFGVQGSHLPTTEKPVVSKDLRRMVSALDQRPTDLGLVLNHYYVRSYEEMLAKAARNDRNAPTGCQPDIERLQKHNLNGIEDKRAQRYLPELKEALKCVSPLRT
jgi:hypothetical protein